MVTTHQISSRIHNQSFIDLIPTNNYNRIAGQEPFPKTYLNDRHYDFDEKIIIYHYTFGLTAI